MNRMKTCAWFVCLAFAPLAHAKKTVLPDACGDDAVQFKVEAVDDHSKELKPEEGKALLVIVEEGVSKHFDLTTRYGIDGAWVGATHTNTYFLVQLTPGEHHLCAAPQKHLGFSDKDRELLIAMNPFTVEAGKVYYFGGKESIAARPDRRRMFPLRRGQTEPDSTSIPVAPRACTSTTTL